MPDVAEDEEFDAEVAVGDDVEIGFVGGAGREAGGGLEDEGAGRKGGVSKCGGFGRD